MSLVSFRKPSFGTLTCTVLPFFLHLFLHATAWNVGVMAGTLTAMLGQEVRTRIPGMCGELERAWVPEEYMEPGHQVSHDCLPLDFPMRMGDRVGGERSFYLVEGAAAFLSL